MAMSFWSSEISLFPGSCSAHCKQPQLLPFFSIFTPAEYLDSGWYYLVKRTPHFLWFRTDSDRKRNSKLPSRLCPQWFFSLRAELKNLGKKFVRVT